MSVFSTGHDGSKFQYVGRFGEQEFDDCLIWCSEHKASDVRIQTNLPVIAEIGGKLVRVTERPITQPEVDGVIKYVYGDNGPGEIKSGHDLDPSHEIRIQERGRIRFRVNVTGGRVPGGDGMQMVIRTLPEIPIDYTKLGLEPEIVENFRPNNGMVLVTGPTGSGKSTLLSSLMRMILEREDANESMVEYSKPVEYVYDKVVMPSSVVFQTEVGRHLRPRHGDVGEESEFAYCVRNALRRKPTIILIGEARDKATIGACVEAALTGHVLYSTMHTVGVAETLRRAVMPFPGDERRAMAIDIMETMRMIVTQTLLPRKEGGKVGCREFMIFDEKTRTRFLEADDDSWPKMARAMLASGEAVGRSMAASARLLLERGEIDERTYRLVAAKSDDRKAH